jgi:hypothetical protein
MIFLIFSALSALSAWLGKKLQNDTWQPVSSQSSPCFFPPLSPHHSLPVAVSSELKNVLQNDSKCTVV